MHHNEVMDVLKRVQELLPVHGGAVWGEEAGGAVAAGPLHGSHHL